MDRTSDEISLKTAFLVVWSGLLASFILWISSVWEWILFIRPLVQCGAIPVFLLGCKLTFHSLHKEDAKPEDDEESCSVKFHCRWLLCQGREESGYCQPPFTEFIYCHSVVSSFVHFWAVMGGLTVSGKNWVAALFLVTENHLFSLTRPPLAPLWRLFLLKPCCGCTCCCVVSWVYFKLQKVRALVL